MGGLARVALAASLGVTLLNCSKVKDTVSGSDTAKGSECGTVSPSSFGAVAAGWSAESPTDESKSTHLWLVNRAFEVLAEGAALAGDARGTSLLGQISDPAGACGVALRRGLNDADILPQYNDGFQGTESEATQNVAYLRCLFGNEKPWRSHFYDPTTGQNYAGETDNTAFTHAHEHFEAARAGAVGAETLPDATCYELGLALHYFTDMTQPMHAVNFTVMSSPALLHQNFENWTTSNVQSTVTKPAWAKMDIETLTDEQLVTQTVTWAHDRWPSFTSLHEAKCAEGTDIPLITDLVEDNFDTKCWEGEEIRAWSAETLSTAIGYAANYQLKWIQAAKGP